MLGRIAMRLYGIGLKPNPIYVFRAHVPFKLQSPNTQPYLCFWVLLY